MALNPTSLSAAIKSAVLADEHVRDNASLQTLCDAIAQAVVAHITSSAVVAVTMPALSIQVAGSPSAQSNPAPCVGTGTIT